MRLHRVFYLAVVAMVVAASDEACDAEVRRAGSAVKGVQLPGFYPSSFPAAIDLDLAWFTHFSWHKFGQWLLSGRVVSSTKALFSLLTLEVDVLDARQLEAEEGLSKAEFFNKHGFVLLDSVSKMSAEDWLASSLRPDNEYIENNEQMQAMNAAQSPARMVYAKELEPLIKQLVPTAHKFFAQGLGVRRGPGGYNMFSRSVHSDFAFDSFDDVSTNPFSPFNIPGFDQQHEADYVSNPKASGWMLLNFWRPVLPMQHPMSDQNQLTFADASNVNADDFVKVTMYGGHLAYSQDYINLKENPKHKWYYYPNMTTSEVLVFKQGHFRKGQVHGEMPVPHSGFSPSPIAPPSASKLWLDFFVSLFYTPTKSDTSDDSEPRCSFEVRLGFIYE